MSVKNSHFELSLGDIQEAQEVLSQYLVPTPVQYNAWLSSKLGCDVFFKLEMMQPIGSFKIRGATYKIASLTDKEKKQGVIAASAGNHAQGVAWGSQRSKVDATIVMPLDAPILKVKNTESLGAKVILEGKHFDESNVIAKEIAKKKKLTFIPAFDDPHVMAGQGTIALEVLKQIPDVDTVIAPIGGGGLLGGMSIALKSLKPDTEVIGCQAAGVNPIYRAFHNQVPVDFSDSPTFADGIAVRAPSDTALRIIQENVDDIYSCEDADIAASILEILEKTKLITEGAGAISLTALEQNRERFKGKKSLFDCLRWKY